MNASTTTTSNNSSNSSSSKQQRRRRQQRGLDTTVMTIPHSLGYARRVVLFVLVLVLVQVPSTRAQPNRQPPQLRQQQQQPQQPQPQPQPQQRDLQEDCTGLSGMKEMETQGFGATSLSELAPPIDGIMFRASRLLLEDDDNDNTTTVVVESQQQQDLDTNVILRGLLLRVAWSGDGRASLPPRVQLYTTREDFTTTDDNINNETTTTTTTVATDPTAWILLADTQLVFPQVYGLPVDDDLSSAHDNAWALVPAHAVSPIAVRPREHRSFYLRLLNHHQDDDDNGKRCQLQNTATAFLALDAIAQEGPHWNLHTGLPTYEPSIGSSSSDDEDDAAWGEVTQQVYAPPLVAAQFHYQLQEPLTYGTPTSTLESCEEAQALAQANVLTPWTTFTMDYEHLIATNAVDRWKPTLEQTEQLHGTVSNRFTAILQSDGYLKEFYNANRISINAVTSVLRGCLGRPNLEMAACQSLLYTVTFNFRGTHLQAHHVQSQLYGYTNYGIAQTVADGVSRLGAPSTTYNIGFERVQAPFSLQLTANAKAPSAPMDVWQMQFLEQAVLNFVNTRMHSVANGTALILRWELTENSVAARGSSNDPATVFTFAGTLYGAQIAQQRYEGDLGHYARTVQTILDTGDMNELRNELRYGSQLPEHADTLMANDVQPARYLLFTQVENVNVTMGRTLGTLEPTEPDNHLDAIFITLAVIIFVGIVVGISMWRYLRHQNLMAAQRKAQREALKASQPAKDKKGRRMIDYDSDDDDEENYNTDSDDDDSDHRLKREPRKGGRRPPRRRESGEGSLPGIEEGDNEEASPVNTRRKMRKNKYMDDDIESLAMGRSDDDQSMGTFGGMSRQSSRRSRESTWRDEY